MAKGKGKRLNLYTKDYVVFDLETTGLSPEEDEIIEISGIRVRDGKPVEEFSTLVNPGRPIPYAAARVNGITDGMVQDAPVLQDALERFLLFAGEDILVGHNIHSFDMPFLYNGAARTLKRGVPNDYVDTLYLARSCMPGRYRYRLTDIAAHFGIETEGAHRALKDCTMNQQCYECMGELLRSRIPGGNAPGTDGAPGEGRGMQGVGTGDAVSGGTAARVTAAGGAARKGTMPEGTVPENICPKCGGVLMRRKGRFGEFWGCSSYPRCRYTRNA